MISQAWRKRLTYAGMSLFLVWHSLAIIVAPAPYSVSAQGLRSLLQPYLSLLRLDSIWSFYAPDPGSMRTSQFRYVVEDKTGNKLTFIPETEFSGFNPSFFWFRNYYNAIADYPESYADIAAGVYCRKHASLHPASITLLDIEEEDFTRSDFLDGKQRWTSEFVTMKTIKRVECPGQ